MQSSERILLGGLQRTWNYNNTGTMMHRSIVMEELANRGILAFPALLDEAKMYHRPSKKGLVTKAGFNL
jgi:hypothetical protein